MKIRKNYFDFYTPKEWQHVIKDREKSGLSIPRYCKKKGIPLTSFYGWKSKLDPSSCSNLKEIRDKWRDLIADWKKSGLSKAEYCKQKGMAREVVSLWEKRLNLSPPGILPLEKWAPIIEDWKQSGLSKAIYCRKKKLAMSSFYAWEKRLNVSESSHPLADLTNDQQAKLNTSLGKSFIPFALNSLNASNVSSTSSKREVTLSQNHHLSLENTFRQEKIDP